MLKTAVIGASGYIGSRLLHRYREQFPDCIGTTFSRSLPNLISFDLRDPELNQLALEETKHQAVLIASGQTNVVWCESHPDESYDLNVRSTLQLIEQLGKTSLTTIFLSSDYVFDGRTGDYSDRVEVSPTTEYGRQKAKVEREIPNLTNNYKILRLSKIYGTEGKDGTLLDSIARTLSQGQVVEAARDKIFNPTHVDDLVSMILFIQQHEKSGLFNLCSPQSYSRYQIALQLSEALNMDSTLVKPVLLSENPLLKHIPLNTSLKRSTILEAVSHLSMNEAVKRVAANWIL